MVVSSKGVLTSDFGGDVVQLSLSKKQTMSQVCSRQIFLICGISKVFGKRLCKQDCPQSAVLLLTRQG